MKKDFNLGIVGFLFLSLLLSGCATPQRFYMKTVRLSNAEITTKMKIAVVPENWYWLGSPNFLPRALITEFLELGFVVIERSQLENILKEVKLDLTGITKKGEETEASKKGVDFGILDKTTIKKIGEILGVDAILVTYIVPTIGDNIDKATFRLVDVETSKVLFSTTFINRKQAESEIVSIGELLPVLSTHIKQLLAGKTKIETKFTMEQGSKIKIITVE
ncbi:MAG: hypothetical protein ABIJ15_07755 [bacterium]